MKSKGQNTVCALVCLFAVCCCIPASAQLQNVVEVNVYNPVAVPGKLLMPGGYLFRVLDRNTIEITPSNRSESVGFFQVLPITRQGDEDTKVELTTPDAHGLRLIQDWFAAGSTDGYQFVYSPSDL